ncbi:Metal-dependent hydrolase, endonuclease/exonuclease/phosphatase family [Catalinimonas alkaloidigena]|uniref:Metal-dependent hydrolase, endonuclease/exonuclease/phosphatase family n=1 Tax=Catalinimonas alkaloidigena TaxID=1075417 RepID=A0A1G9SE67_9BACT|nr:endonuclease/exonuclease/phosphatase family protein [Catalinimonas alkaloidigena]SDM33763.1 Metal-dependent hydrolase, endonuclease/exonuclease/phosphatase family [Catalinimonas alkaloidigena]
MSRTFLFPFVLMSLLTLSSLCSQDLRVATYNIRYDAASDTLDRWSKRHPFVAQLVQFHDFDIFGVQEALHHQMQDLSGKLPGYAFIGVGRDDGKQKGEYSAIFYKKDRFEVLKQSTFWLAETTDKPVKGWDAALPRICTWGQFRDKATGKTFYFFNTHFDHVGVEARKNSAKLIVRKIKEIAGNAPVVLTGDLNLGQDSDAYKIFRDSPELHDTHDTAQRVYDNNGSFNGFGYRPIDDQRIDHVFVSDQFQVATYGLLTDTYYGRYPSDHFPVMAVLRY